ncbi:HesA/MoeB/ThiF family protein [Paenirhodobacter sp.]|uniref:HesA/MoeB/ThiF family protein n=1 Tax=Paenirhodobacter sp. TaxID=1965326 RepID=UPI003B3F0BE6
MDRGHAMNRYARQEAVLGADAQARLRAARVLVVGAGGLGAPVLPYLAGAGVGLIRLADPDRVEATNLHRQTLFRMDDIGTPKALAAAAALRALNPDCRVEPMETMLDPANAATLAQGVDLVLDCADSFAVAYILSDLCRDMGLPLIHAAVTGTEGYAGGFCGGAPSLRAVFPDLPQQMGSCARDGVLGPVVGVLGAVQAQMAVAQLAGLPSPLGRLISYDGAAHRFGGFAFTGAPEPTRAPRFVAPSQLTPQDLIIDLRGADEAPLFPRARRCADVTTLHPAAGQRVALCCRSGMRAFTAAETLAATWPGEIALVALGDPT